MAPPITKVECGLGRGRRVDWWGGDVGGGIWAFLSCRHAGCFIAISQHLPWMANIMWRCSPEKKRTISTGMYCHLMPYFNCSLYNSVKSGPEAVGSFSAHMFALSSKVTKAQGHAAPPHPRNMPLCTEPWTSQHLFRSGGDVLSFPRMDQVKYENTEGQNKVMVNEGRGRSWGWQIGFIF